MLFIALLFSILSISILDNAKVYSQIQADESPLLSINSPNRCIITGNCIKNCSIQAYSPSCLSEEVPLWTANISTIKCCFSCCLEFFSNKFHVHNKINASKGDTAQLQSITSIFITPNTPLDLTQENPSEWGKQTRLEKYYHSIPFPQYLYSKDISSGIDLLGSSLHSISMFSPLPSNTHISLDGLSLTHKNLEKWIFHDSGKNSSIDRNACARHIDCSKKVSY